MQVSASLTLSERLVWFPIAGPRLSDGSYLGPGFILSISHRPSPPKLSFRLKVYLLVNLAIAISRRLACSNTNPGYHLVDVDASPPAGLLWQ
ncbi:hypothetical protein L249_1294 [Ophiocordyceps polyrhachis-furcata BCC 54312]|uniref:Uncharacterized protein n=1 Tax=Ophiocordyceps polyrhachis-furcata BCC 54312 TaxID=1330021 RepID=A0A367LDT0_9HYPO|nr:hypothetical protein L249_1294 [Ophiocordyceps polyrhachis-furcata BCC 54312]